MRILVLSILTLVTAGSGLCSDVNFAAPLSAAKTKDGTVITFAVSAKTDVEVSVLNAKGEVVRHLAAGVLGGEKPPPEPLKPGLSQSLTWDGKDDFGKAVDGGPFKVRACAGIGVKFGRMIGEDPYTFGAIDSITTDQDGNLYITASSSECYQSAQILRVFNPEGKYLRTLIPFAADLKPESISGLATWNAATKTFSPKNYSSGNPTLYPFPGNIRLVSASKQTGLVMTAETTLWHMDLDGSNLKGPNAMWSPGAKLVNAGWNKPQLAVSPDGKYIYYSNVAGTQYEPKKFSDTNPAWPQGRVYRQDTSKPGSDPVKFYDLELPDWEKTKFWLPNAWNCRTAAYHIVTDAKGHVYICDLVNQEIVEVDADGKKVSATKVPWPEQVQVDQKTGNYYVFSRVTPLPNEGSPIKLLKIVGRGADAKIATELPLTMNVNRAGFGTCLGHMGEAPVLWIGAGTTLLCVKDDGAKLALIESAFKPAPDAQLDFGRIFVDSVHDEVYTNNAHKCLYRYDGKTGQGGLLKKNGKPFYGVDMAIGYDDSLYIRTGESHVGPLERFTRELEPLPFATGTNRLWEIYSRMGIGFCDKGLGAGPNGECYVSYMYDWNKYFVAGFGGDGKAIKGKYLDGKMKKPEPASWAGKLSADRWVTSAVVGPIPASSGGIAVDASGNIYVGMLVQPKTFTPEAGFEKDPAYNTWTGSIVKFPPSGGTVLGAVAADDPANAEGTKTVCGGNLTVVGALNVYPGVAPFSGGGYGGNSSCCVCRVPRFGVDRYGRIVYTNVTTCSATMIDNAGNKMLEFGAYGNFDSQYVSGAGPAGAGSPGDTAKSGKPVIGFPEFPLAWPSGAGSSDKYIYVNDTYNKRVLRADKTWKCEAACAIK